MPASSTARPDPSELATFDPDATAYTEFFGPLDPGSYRIDTVGTPFSFTTREPSFIQLNGRGEFALSHPDSNGPDDRGIEIRRVSSLTDPTTDLSLSREGHEEGDDWPAADFAAWLDNTTDEIVVLEREQTTLGGLDATYAELELGDTDCIVSRPCLLATNHRLTGKTLAAGSRYRIWMVDQGDVDPIAVVVMANRATDRGWFDTADEILATLAFGEIAANPIQDADGVVELPALGGIRTELAQPAVVIREPAGGVRIAPVGQPGDSEFLIAPNDSAGQAVETIDELLAVLETGDVEITELEPTEIDGLEARVLDIGSVTERGLLTRTASTDALWFPPPRGRMWAVEHPERGLLIITAEAFIDPDEVFPIVLAQTEAVIDTLEFIELD